MLCRACGGTRSRLLDGKRGKEAREMSSRHKCVLLTTYAQFHPQILLHVSITIGLLRQSFNFNTMVILLHLSSINREATRSRGRFRVSVRQHSHQYEHRLEVPYRTGVISCISAWPSSALPDPLALESTTLSPLGSSVLNQGSRSTTR